MRRVDYVFSIGDRALSFHRLFKPKVFFVPYGIKLPKDIILKEDLRPTNDQDLQLIFSGGLVNRHNFKFMLELLYELIMVRNIKAELFLNGDGPEKNSILEMAKTMNIDWAIRFGSSFNTWEERLEAYVDKDFFLYPTSHSGWGLVIPEALAHGNIVLSTDMAESARYAIKNNYNGYLLEIDINKWAETIENIYKDKRLLKKFKKNALKSSSKLNVNQSAILFEKSLMKVMEGFAK
jgi:glycosyltransferase involved in cell wall biosynthesis